MLMAREWMFGACMAGWEGFSWRKFVWMHLMEGFLSMQLAGCSVFAMVSASGYGIEYGKCS